MSSPSWISPVRLALRPAFLCLQFATAFTVREKYGARPRYGSQAYPFRSRSRLAR